MFISYYLFVFIFVDSESSVRKINLDVFLLYLKFISTIESGTNYFVNTENFYTFRW